MTCRKCGADLPEGRKKNICTKCSTEQHRAWAARNREHLRAYQAERRAANPEHYRDQKRASFRRRFGARMALLDAVKSVPCVDCGGEFPPVAMDLDHVRGEKMFSLSQWANGCVRATDQEVQAEIDNCDVRCANCHRIRHGRPATDGGTA